MPGNIKTEELIEEILKINKKIKIILISKNNYKNVYEKIEKFNKTEIKKIIEKNTKKSEKIKTEKDIKKTEKIKTEKDIKKTEKIKTEKNIKKTEKNTKKSEIIKSEKIYKKIEEPENKEIFTKYNLKNNSKKIKNGKIICILGSNGVGKSIFSIMVSRKFIEKNILIINFDFFNSSLQTILNAENHPQKIKENSSKKSLNKIKLKKEIDILDYIVKTKYKNIDLIYGLNILFDSKEEKNYEKIIKELKQKYDIIIFDTSLQTFLDYTKKMMEMADTNIMISGANLLEVKKTTNLLKIYNEEWKIEKNKIKLVFNKCTKNSIDFKILKKIFEGYKIIGKIKLSDYYDIVINNSTERLNEIEKEVKKIGDQILIEKNKIYKIVK